MITERPIPYTDGEMEIAPTDLELKSIESEQASDTTPIELKPLLQDATAEEEAIIMDYWDKARTLPLLPHEEIIHLIKEYQVISQLLKNGTNQDEMYARRLNDIITTITAHNSRLILWIVNQNIPQLRKADMTIQDGLQEGSIGMIRAIKRFDPNLQYRFSTYTTWWVRHAVTRAIQNGGMIRLPVNQHEYLQQLRHTMTQTGLQDIEISQLNEGAIDQLAVTAIQLGYHELTKERIVDLIQLNILPVASLDKPLNNTSDGSLYDDGTLMDFIPSDSSTEEEVIDIVTNIGKKKTIEHLLEGLSTPEEIVIRLRFGLPFGSRKHAGAMTLEEIGNKMGYTRERIRQIEASAKNKIKKMGLSLKDVDSEED